LEVSGRIALAEGALADALTGSLETTDQADRAEHGSIARPDDEAYPKIRRGGERSERPRSAEVRPRSSVIT
jgi:hypothetical protein